MGIKFTIRDQDKGWRDIRKAVKEVGRGADVHVGIFSDKAGGGADRGGINNVQLAQIHEFGAGRIPARPFMRATFKENASKYFLQMKRMVQEVFDGKLKQRTSLNKLGKMVAEDIKDRVLSGPHIPPPLSSVTVEKKGHSRPLVDTESMIESVTWKTSLGRKARKI